MTSLAQLLLRAAIMLGLVAEVLPEQPRTPYDLAQHSGTSSQVAEHKHTFKRIRDEDEEGGGGRGHEAKRPQATVPAAAARKKKTLLSFGGEEEEEEG